jgi:Ion transport protein
MTMMASNDDHRAGTGIRVGGRSRGDRASSSRSSSAGQAATPSKKAHHPTADVLLRGQVGEGNGIVIIEEDPDPDRSSTDDVVGVTSEEDNNTSSTKLDARTGSDPPSLSLLRFRQCSDSVNRFRHLCGMFVNNGVMQVIVILLISINAVMMGLATYDFVKDNDRVLRIFEIVDQTFLIIFTVELGLQFVYLGFRILLDGWLVFDLIVIVTSWSFASVQIVRAFRIFRALRLVTRIKVLKDLVVGE